MRDFEVIQKFVEDSNYAEDEASLVSSFKQAINHFGFQTFSCLSLTDYTKPEINALNIVELPEEWTIRYLENEYHKKDIILEKMAYSLTPVEWSTLESPTKEQALILNEATDFGLVNGMSLPIFVPGLFPTTFSISGNEEDIDKNCFPILYMLAMYFHEAVLRIRSISSVKTYIDLQLTPREKECLQWAAVGKSDNVIADILNISKSTVHFHIENAKRKFNVPTRVQTVVKAIYMGKIVPHDFRR